MILVIQLGHKLTHVTTAELSWPDWIFRIKITINGIFIRFQLWAHKCFVKWVLDYKHGWHTSHPIHKNIHMVLLCFVLFVVIAAVPGGFMWYIYPYPPVLLHWHWGNKSYDCPSVSEVILKNMGKINHIATTYWSINHGHISWIYWIPQSKAICIMAKCIITESVREIKNNLDNGPGKIMIDSLCIWWNPNG